LTSAINPRRQKLKICLKPVAKICNGKRFVDTDGKHVGENKREAKPLKEQRK
jgi:hypothetical protein